MLAALLIGLLLWLPVAPCAAAPPAADPPDITATVGIVVEYPSGRVLFDKDMHKHMAEASTTKIMTALLVLQRTRLSDEVQIIDEDQVGEFTMGLVPGETQTVENLLYGLMLPSGNDAAMALARNVGSTPDRTGGQGAGGPLCRPDEPHRPADGPGRHPLRQPARLRRPGPLHQRL